MVKTWKLVRFRRCQTSHGSFSLIQLVASSYTKLIRSSKEWHAITLLFQLVCRPPTINSFTTKGFSYQISHHSNWTILSSKIKKCSISSILLTIEESFCSTWSRPRYKKWWWLDSNFVCSKLTTRFSVVRSILLFPVIAANSVSGLHRACITKFIQSWAQPPSWSNLTNPTNSTFTVVLSIVSMVCAPTWHGIIISRSWQPYLLSTSKDSWSSTNQTNWSWRAR